MLGNSVLTKKRKKTFRKIANKKSNIKIANKKTNIKIANKKTNRRIASNKIISTNISINITDILYKDIHDFALHQALSIDDANKLEHEFLFIIDSLSIFILGTNIFSSDFKSENGFPIEKKLLLIQESKQNIPEDLLKSKYSSYMANKLFILIQESINKKIILLDNQNFNIKDYITVKKNMYDFNDKYDFIANLKKENPKFIEYIEEGMKN